MTAVNLHHEEKKPGSSLSAQTAIRLAWGSWIALMAIPFFLVLWLVWDIVGSPLTPRRSETAGWFMAAMAYVAVVIPASFFLREYVFHAYWTGKTVSPGKYLVGMICVWSALVTAAVFSVAGSVATSSLMPNLIPAVLLLIYYFTQWPTGRAMTGSGDSDPDPQMSEQPR